MSLPRRRASFGAVHRNCPHILWQQPAWPSGAQTSLGPGSLKGAPQIAVTRNFVATTAPHRALGQLLREGRACGASPGQPTSPFAVASQYALNLQARRVIVAQARRASSQLRTSLAQVRSGSCQPGRSALTVELAPARGPGESHSVVAIGPGALT